MGVNAMQITDVYQLLNNVHAQATGQASITPTTTDDFVSMATTTLAAGTDIVYSTLMDYIMRPIFAVRDYNEKFKGLYRTNNEFGAIRRKISYCEKPMQRAAAMWDASQLVDGGAIDPWIINKADVLEMRFYGSAVYDDSLTIFEDQIKTAFSGPEELGAFVTGMMTNQNNKYKQYREELARATLANFIGAKNDIDSASVIHLLTEYNTLTGQSLTAQDIYQEANIAGFFRWVRARINTLARQMRERSEKFQVTVTGKPVMRHTENADLKIYMLADALDIIDTMVNTVTFHDEPLAYADVEGVTYWQAIDTPDEIKVTPSVITAAGVYAQGNAQTMSKVFGVMFDKDAMAINQYMYRVDNTPMNARGRYYNTFLHARLQYTNDLTEKGIVLLLD